MKSIKEIEPDEKTNILANTIMECMRKNNMVLEHLDDATVLIEHAYRKNATIKG